MLCSLTWMRPIGSRGSGVQACGCSGGHMPTRGRLNAVLIANPRAGHGKGARLIEQARTRLRAAGLEPVVHETTAPGHGRVLAEQFRDAVLVIALGGDGTLHEVLNGLFRHDQPPRAALGILPAGT